MKSESKKLDVKIETFETSVGQIKWYTSDPEELDYLMRQIDNEVDFFVDNSVGELDDIDRALDEAFERRRN